jgi:beta-phosphoglucomutase-like phosphatase (HAD superfamily)
VIKAIIFDLDGTLVRTEDLKALSYARAAVSLRPTDLTESMVIRTFTNVVGLPRQEVSEALLKEFGLEEPARARMQKHNVATPWEAFAMERLAIYEAFLETPAIFGEYTCPYNVGLLEYVRREGFLVALATMSHRKQVTRILELLGQQHAFNIVATRDDVMKGKPDPEIYIRVAGQLGVLPAESLVIEDSVNGIKAALAAEMLCIAVTTNLTRDSVHKSGLIDKRWIVNDPAQLMTITRRMIAERGLVDVKTRK